MTTQTDDKRMIAEFLDRDMGLPVLLLNSVCENSMGNCSGVVVPDVLGLQAAMAVARIMDDFKLNGTEIRFLRRSIGMKATELAKFLDMSAETVSRWENNKELISTNAERVLRLRVYNTLKDRAPGVLEADINKIMDMTFKSVRKANGGTMAFRRALVLIDGKAVEIWMYTGIRSIVTDISADQKLSA